MKSGTSILSALLVLQMMPLVLFMSHFVYSGEKITKASQCLCLGLFFAIFSSYSMSGTFPPDDPEIFPSRGTLTYYRYFDSWGGKIFLNAFWTVLILIFGGNFLVLPSAHLENILNMTIILAIFINCAYCILMMGRRYHASLDECRTVVELRLNQEEIVEALFRNPHVLLTWIGTFRHFKPRIANSILQFTTIHQRINDKQFIRITIPSRESLYLTKQIMEYNDYSGCTAITIRNITTLCNHHKIRLDEVELR